MVGVGVAEVEGDDGGVVDDEEDVGGDGLVLVDVCFGVVLVAWALIVALFLLC